MSPPRILAFGGSLRTSSFNQKIAVIVARGARGAGMAVILAASPGGYGGSRGLTQLRPFLENIGITVLPEQVTIPKVHEVMDADGEFTDATLQLSVLDLGAAFAKAIG